MEENKNIQMYRRGYLFAFTIIIIIILRIFNYLNKTYIQLKYKKIKIKNSNHRQMRRIKQGGEV